MKRIILVLIGAVRAFVLPAQTSDAEAATLVELINMHAKEAMVRLVSVVDTDSLAFWKLYDEYKEKTAIWEKSRIQLYGKAALSYGSNMDSRTADSLAHRYFEIRIEQEKVLQEYYEKIKSATNAVTAFEFYQAEIFMSARVRVNFRGVAAIYARIDSAARQKRQAYGLQ